MSYGIPEKVQIGDDVELTITVRNTGGQTGNFRANIHVRTPDSNWEEGGEWVFSDVAPGETTTATIDDPITFRYVNRFEFRLGRSQKTAIVQTVSAKVAWGKEYRTPDGYRIRVDEPTFQDSYEYENWQGEIEDEEPDNGGQWAFVNVWVKNETGQTSFSPLASEFALITGNSQFDGETVLVDEPIDKNEPFEGGELQPGIERNGWIAYQLPGGVSNSDLKMAWSQSTINGEIAVNWSSK